MENILGFIGSHISDQVGYVSNLKRNVDDLMGEAQKLKDQCDDMESEGQEASRKRMRLTNQARTWIGHARANITEIENIKSEFDRRQTSNHGFFSDFSSTYTLGKRAVEKLESVRRDLNERSGIKLLAMSSPPRVIEMPVPTVGQISDQRILEKIWNLLRDEHTGVICIYGMGGIGKTTLMKVINNSPEAAREFDYVIWVPVSRQLDLQTIQKYIMERLWLGFNENASYQDRSSQLREYLSNKRYMLILDDLWNSFNLCELGIPTNKENGSKIAITTRIANMSAVEVCSDMKAEKIRIETLAEKEAWDLFAANVGKEVVHQPHIKDVANDVVMECGGLPLAIVVVAKAMEGQNKRELWQNAFRALRAPSAPDIEDMEPKVFLPLKLSYDDLKDEVKKCFLYCSLCPEDYEISVKELIWRWMMEGFIDNVDNLGDASKKGHSIVEDLKRRCLLEEGIKKNRVKMHDIIRDLALYIASSSSNEGPEFSVKAKVGLNEPAHEGTWRKFERISLMSSRTTKLPPIRPEWPNLVSLLLKANHYITAFPDDFFELMPALQVLDLSYTSITSWSVSSSSLLNLRALILTGCGALTEVPFLGQLKELQFLDIKSTRIRRLPVEMQNLVKLKQLKMSELKSDSFTIPSNVLSSLEDLRIQETNEKWARGSEFADVILAEVGKLKRLIILKVTILDFDWVKDDVFLPQLPNLKTFEVEIGGHDPFGFREMKCMKCMKKVYAYCLKNYRLGVKEMVKHTDGLKLCRADVKDVSQLVGDANGLRFLEIRRCEKMERILDWSVAGVNALQNIEDLRLSLLSNLQKLFEGAVPQGCLQKLNKIELLECKNLESLFSSEMVQNLDQLQALYVGACAKLEEIIEGDDNSLPENPFPQLRNFTLKRLPKLKSIIRRDTLALPSLIKLEIDTCRNLRLPRRPDTTDWPSITRGGATWEANPQ